MWQASQPGLQAPHLRVPPPPLSPGQSLTCDEGPRRRHVHDGVAAHRPRLRREHEVVQPAPLPQLLLDPGARAAALPGGVPEPQSVPDSPQQHRSLELLHVCPRLRAPAVLLSLQSALLTSGLVILQPSGACPSGRRSSSVSAGGTNENTVWTAARSLAQPRGAAVSLHRVRTELALVWRRLRLRTAPGERSRCSGDICPVTWRKHSRSQSSGVEPPYPGSVQSITRCTSASRSQAETPSAPGPSAPATPHPPASTRPPCPCVFMFPGLKITQVALSSLRLAPAPSTLLGFSCHARGFGFWRACDCGAR